MPSKCLLLLQNSIKAYKNALKEQYMMEKQHMRERKKQMRKAIAMSLHGVNSVGHVSHEVSVGRHTRYDMI